MKTMRQTTFFALLFLTALAAITACNRQPKAPEISPLTEEESARFLEQGQEIAQATFAAMSGRLQAAMQEGGVAHAAQYCNTAALPIADSLSGVYGAKIRRTSLKVRNPEDRPDDLEKSALEQYARDWSAQLPLKPKAVLIDNQTVAFYAPIKVNAFCLSCHGEVGASLKAEDYATLKSLYPEDQAVGYQDGDWRGLWSIRFDRNLHEPK
jgi:cytochrome c553